MRVSLVGVWLVGCGAYVERQKELCHPETGCLPRPFWADDDGDGWGAGDPDAPDAVAVDPPPGMAGNLMDCDDADSSITADIGGLCPSSFTGGAEAVGQVEGAEEQVLLIAGDPLNAIQAEDVCGTPGWGGALGGSVALVEERAGSSSVWVASTPADLGARWAEVPGRDDLIEGRPVLWAAGTLRVGDPVQGALVLCARPTPNPEDYQVPAEAP